MATKQELLAQLSGTISQHEVAQIAPVDQTKTKNNLLSKLSVASSGTPIQEAEESSVLELLKRDILGIVEPIAAIATGAIAAPIAGIKGGITAAFDGVDEGVRVIEETQEALTFRPRTELGQETLQDIGDIAQEIGTRVPAGLAGLGQLVTGAGIEQAASTTERILEKGISREIGDQVLAATDNPALAAAAATVPTAALEILGFKGANTLRGSKQLSGIPDNVARTLDRENISTDDLTPQNIRTIQDAVDKDLRDQVERAELLRSQGIEPTQAQITRDATDFQTQQELTKKSGRVRDALEGQEALLVNRFDESIAGTGGQPVTSGSPVTDTIINRSTVLDNEISDLYRQAREVAPDAKNVRMTELAKILRQRAPSNDSAQGLIKSIRGNLVERGILDKNFNVTGRVNVTTAEEVRKFINTHFDSTSPLGRGFMREFKDALDNDVLSVAGGDIFSRARNAKATFEKDLNRAKINKFDARKGSLVRDILENKFDPDKIGEKISTSTAIRRSDVEGLKKYLTETGTPDQRSAGLDAWNDLRAQTLNSIKDRAFTGPEDAIGNKALSRSSLETSINRVGKPKLDVLFTRAENKFIDDILRITKIREPVRGTALGRGPSAQAIERTIGNLERRLDKLPGIGVLIDSIAVDRQGRIALKGKPRKPLAVQVIEGKAPGIATAAALTGIIEKTKQEEQ